jgi:hypothetical protein
LASNSTQERAYIPTHNPDSCKQELQSSKEYNCREQGIVRIGQQCYDKVPIFCSCGRMAPLCVITANGLGPGFRTQILSTEAYKRFLYHAEV